MNSDHIGRQLGNYRLTRLLGKGGFADVYLGEHIYLRTQAAIKILQTRLTDADTEKFLYEARTIANLVHPHIIKVLDFGLEEDTPFLVLEYAPNGTLRQQYARGITLPANTILPYVKQVAAALMYAHEHKVIHRDIKPENMLVGHNSELLLSDFGIALVTQSSRYQGTMETVGTAGYMAPEQIQGRPVPASDQYALGIVVYEWLTGDRPFHGTFTEVASQQLFAPPPSLRQKIPSISPDIEEVVMMALVKDAQQRFHNVQAFAHAFEQACGGNLPTYVTPPAASASPTYITPPTRPAHDVTIVATPYNSPVQQSDNALPVYPPEQQPASKGPSRRAVLIGMAGLGMAMIGGGIAWWEVAQHSTAASTPNITPTSLSVPPAPTATAQPQPPTPTATSQPQPPTPTATTQPQPPTPTATKTNPSTGNLLYTYHGHTGSVYADTWSPDGGRVASCAEDHTVQVWNATTGGNVLIYRGHSNVVYALSWSPQQFIASGGDDKIVQVWNATDGTNQFSYTNHTQSIYTIAWSPNGQRVASGSVDKTVQVWDGTTGSNALTYTGHSDIVRSVTWSPSGSRIASASEDRTVQVWDANSQTNYMTYSGHTDGVLIVAWSPNGNYIASGGRDTKVRVWNANTGETVFVYAGHSLRVWGVAWSPDGQRIASAGKDGTVQIWDAMTGNNVFTYRGHTSTVWSALWSSDGQRIASASNDGTVQVWQAS